MSLLKQAGELRNKLCKIYVSLTGDECTCNSAAAIMPEYQRDINWLVSQTMVVCGIADEVPPSPFLETTRRDRSPSPTVKTRKERSPSPVGRRRTGRDRSRSPLGRTGTRRDRSNSREKVRFVKHRRDDRDDRDEPKSVYVYYDTSKEGKDIPEPFYEENAKKDEEARLGQIFSNYGVVSDIKIWYYEHRSLERKVPVAKVIFRFPDEKTKCLASYNEILNKHNLRVQSSKF